MRDTRPLLINTDFPQVRRKQLETLQVNLGYLCNISCTHCHVNAGPRRKELMDRETIDLVLDFLDRHQIRQLDMTGGSPEMNPHYSYLVTSARGMGVALMDRCNPTIIEEPGYEHLPEFYADNEMTIVASMPCYQEQNVDKQRGKGVYQRSIAGLKKLNDVGYGKPGTGLSLNLVYNPDEPILPPSQEELQEDYKRELFDAHGIVFNELYCIANMPISRFGARLLAKGDFIPYMLMLRESFEPSNLETVMCRHLISVDWQGYVYDCDFNQMMDVPVIDSDNSKPTLRDLRDK
ncbi:MAG: arsenosugar biosynthesis radical SAM protein ArsS, partial [Pseudomonadales bacterium]|nr:arsenosugar biosynthesis radical SAM protein ArsS [Pseudomonadales bacterium]